MERHAAGHQSFHHPCRVVLASGQDDMKEIGDVELSAVSPIGEKEKPQFLDI